MSLYHILLSKNGGYNITLNYAIRHLFQLSSIPEITIHYFSRVQINKIIIIISDFCYNH